MNDEGTHDDGLAMWCLLESCLLHNVFGLLPLELEIIAHFVCVPNVAYLPRRFMYLKICLFNSLPLSRLKARASEWKTRLVEGLCLDHFGY